jgi:hypothetical protein
MEDTDKGVVFSVAWLIKNGEKDLAKSLLAEWGISKSQLSDAYDMSFDDGDDAFSADYVTILEIL